MPEPWLPPFVHPPAPAEHPPSRPPRSRRWRVTCTAVAVVADLGLESFFSSVDRHGRWLPPVPHLDVVSGLWSLLLMAALAWVLPKVSYRRRDALLVMVPFLEYWFVGLAVWRLCRLPYRDWRPRDDELPSVRVVPGTPLHVLEPAEPKPAGGPAPSTMLRPGRSVAPSERS